MGKLVVTVVSDLACPWCYLGKVFLDEAIEALVGWGIETEVRWRAYMIDPATKPDGEEYMAYNRRRWGGDGWTEELRQSASTSKAARFARWVTWPNTVNAHRVLRFLRGALGWKAEHEAMGRLLHACYEEGQNISKLEVCLAAISSIPGVKVDEVRAGLRGDALTHEVREEDRYAKQDLEITGVPHAFLELDGARGQLAGCRPPRHWLALVKHLHEAGPVTS